MVEWSDFWYITGLIGIIVSGILSVIGVAFVISWAFDYQWWAVLAGIVTACIIGVGLLTFAICKVCGLKSGHYF